MSKPSYPAAFNVNKISKPPQQKVAYKAVGGVLKKLSQSSLSFGDSWKRRYIETDGLTVFEYAVIEHLFNTIIISKK